MDISVYLFTYLPTNLKIIYISKFYSLWSWETIVYSKATNLSSTEIFVLKYHFALKEIELQKWVVSYLGKGQYKMNLNNFNFNNGQGCLKDN